MPSLKSRGASPLPELIRADAVLAIVGPTASGKSEWALQLAEQLGGEIVSADSRQLYRRLDIGSAKPTPADRARARHHCLDLREPNEPISLAEYLTAARAAIDEIHGRGRLPIIVGGSGQYVWALLEGWIVPPAPPDPAFRRRLEAEAERRGAAAIHAELADLDPEAAGKIEPRNLRRVIRALEVHRATGETISSWQQRRQPLFHAALAPLHEQRTLDERIERRTVQMFRDGMIDEVRALLADGVPESAPGFDAIGYREVLAWLRGGRTLLDTAADAVRATQRFSRRQRAWFRPGDPRIVWSEHMPAADLIRARIQRLG